MEVPRRKKAQVPSTSSSLLFLSLYATRPWILHLARKKRERPRGANNKINNKCASCFDLFIYLQPKDISLYSCSSHLISPRGPGKEKKGENPTRVPNSQPDPAPDRTSPHRKNRTIRRVRTSSLSGNASNKSGGSGERI